MKNNYFIIRGKQLSILLILLFFNILNLYSQEMQFVNPQNSDIQYMGRFDDSNPVEFQFAYPGTSITAKFEGTRLDAILIEYGSGSSTTTNYFNVIIDDAEPVVIELSRSDTLYTLAEGLTDEIHTVQLFKRTETSVGKVGFKGFMLEAGSTLLTPDPLPERKMMFIGNSITCGYGNEVSTTSPNNFPFTSTNENNYNAWGAITSRNLDAQYHCIAFSGRGLNRNYDGSQNGLAPEFFNQTIAGSSIAWDHSNYIPDVVVINLGTNDFSAETGNQAYYVEEETFVNAYIDFIGNIKTVYPDASIVCAVGVMMNDYYPSGAEQWSRIQNYAQSAVQATLDNGLEDIHYLMLDPQNSPYGEDWHPTVETQTRMASTLTELASTIFEERACQSPFSLGRDISTNNIQYPVIIGVNSEENNLTTYQWYKNDTLLQGQIQPQLQLNDGNNIAGTYRLEKDSAQCHFSDELTIVDGYIEVGVLANWADNKDAAVVMTFDDWSNGHPNIAVPQLYERGFVGTFNITSSFVSNWATINDAYAKGNEIANHSRTHANISAMDPSNFYSEISQPESIIESEIENLDITTFAYPFGTYNSELVDTLIAHQYVGARGVQPSSQNYTYNFAPSEHDYFNILTYPMSESLSESSFGNQVTNIINGGGLLTLLYHSLNSPTVTDNNYSAVSEYKFEKQLDTLLAYEDDIWITTFEKALKYHKEKNCASLLEISAPTNSEWLLNLTDTLSNDSLYNQPLTIMLPVEGHNYDMIIQNGNHIIIDSIFNDMIIFKAIPDAGYIYLYNTGIESSMESSRNSLYNSDDTDISFSLTVDFNIYPIFSVSIDLSSIGNELQEMTAVGNGAYEITTTIPAALPVGNHRVNCFITDEEGNIHTNSLYINVMSGIEIGRFVINSEDEIFTDTEQIEFLVEANDDSGISSVLIDLTAIGEDNAIEMSLQTDGTYTYTLSNNEFTAGTKMVTATIIDNVGNIEKQSISFSITEAQIEITPTKIEEKEKAIAILPNPTSDFIEIKNIKEPFYCELYDFLGNKILSEVNTRIISVKDYSQGLYMVKVTTPETNEVYTIIKK